MPLARVLDGIDQGNISRTCCPLLSAAAPLINLGNINNFSHEKFWERRDLNLGQLDTKRERYLRAMPSPMKSLLVQKFKISFLSDPDFSQKFPTFCFFVLRDKKKWLDRCQVKKLETRPSGSRRLASFVPSKH